MERMTQEDAMATATAEQMATIEAMRVDDVARAMIRAGVSLTWEQVDSLSDEQRDWITRRLGLVRDSDDRGAHYAASQVAS